MMGDHLTIESEVHVMNVKHGNVLLGRIKHDEHGYWFVPDTTKKYEFKMSAWQLEQIVKLMDRFEKGRRQGKWL